MTELFPFLRKTMPQHLNQVKNTPKVVGISLSCNHDRCKYAIMRCLHERKQSLQQGKKHWFIFKNKKERFEFSWKHLKQPARFWKKIFGLMKPEWWGKYGEEKKNRSGSKGYHMICQTCWRQRYAWSCIAARGTEPLVFIDDVTTVRSSRFTQMMKN